jgi:hypothetical protein
MFQAPLKGEILMLVPGTADGSLSTAGSLQSLDKGEVVSLNTSSFPRDRCVLPLLKYLHMRTPEADILEELDALHIIL